MLGLSSNHILALTSIASLLLTAGAIYFSVRGIKHQLWLQTFAEFTRRYSELARDLPAAARDPKLDLARSDFSGADQSRLLFFARGYFNLCSEEHFLHARGRIDKVTWQIWCCGIDDMLRLRWVQELWRDLRHEYTGYRGFSEFLEIRAAAAARVMPGRAVEGSSSD